MHRKFVYPVFTGSKETMERIAQTGATALNSKTMHFQIINRKASYSVKPIPGTQYCRRLLSDLNLIFEAKEKGLIL